MMFLHSVTQRLRVCTSHRMHHLAFFVELEGWHRCNLARLCCLLVQINIHLDKNDMRKLVCQLSKDGLYFLAGTAPSGRKVDYNQLITRLRYQCVEFRPGSVGPQISNLQARPGGARAPDPPPALLTYFVGTSRGSGITEPRFGQGLCETERLFPQDFPKD